MKSIKSRIALGTGVTVAVFVLLVGFVSILLSYRSSEEQLEISMTGTAQVTTERITKELEAYSNIVSSVGSMPEIADPQVSVDEKKAVIDSWAEEYGFQRGNILDVNGDSLFDGNNYSDREYFQESMEGNQYISTPVISKVTGELTIMVSAPLWKNGEPGTEVIGVVYFVPPETFLNDIVSTIHISDNSSAYMIDSAGNTIADVTTETVGTENIEELAKEDDNYASLGAIHKVMREGKSGFDKYEKDGISKVIAYAPVSGTDGWSVAIIAPNSDFQKATTQAIIAVAVLMAVSIVIALFIAIKLAKNIADPVKKCASRLEALSVGDLHTEVPQVKTKDEIKMLADATAVIVATMNDLIENESELLSEMARGNFDVYPRQEVYVGDLSLISQHINEINAKLSSTMDKIKKSAAQVSSGSSQVAEGAQSLSQGSVEQASSVEELAGTINMISNDMQKTAKVAETSKDAAESAGAVLTVSNEKMHELSNAMEEINNASEEIGKIIKTIEDIAFQTNILALNAAVEAARAGSAGKGFAVVADEVRNLASKSSMASKDTSALIERTLQSVETGTKLTKDTQIMMDKTAESAQYAVELMGQISGMVEEQAKSAAQVTAGIDQISSVVQMNSATAQESAATSEELSSQAEFMNKLVDAFTLRK